MVIVFNPAAGRRRAHLLWRVLDPLIASGVRLEIVETTRRGDARVLARDAAAKGARLVVAAGGDGTIAEVSNGLIGTDAALGVIPLGTANVLAHEIGLPFLPTAIAAALAFGRTRLLWPGVAQGPNGARLFVQMLGAGFDAQVVHRLPLPLKRLFGRGAYALQTARELIRYRFPPIHLRVDGQEHRAGSVIVSKGRLYGGRYLLAPEALAHEPGFSVVLFERSGPLTALLCGALLPLGLLPRAPGLRRLRARRVEILGGTAAPVQADGDEAGWAPLSITDAAAPIRVVAA
ncbi:MAG: diacylglycerol kinase family lipid kinase [Acetobacteraceae bacterium]|nr:diacylglycerol kinase family lipid kinase [Acetobacteraceae bacterium]